MGCHSLAKSVNKKLFSLVDKYSMPIFRACSYYIDAKISMKQGDYLSADQLFEKGINLAESNHNRYYLTEMLYDYATLEQLQKNYQHALELVSKSIEVGSVSGLDIVLDDGKLLRERLKNIVQIG
jgi:tetratricopeptide (TPR) repeat protein